MSADEFASSLQDMADDLNSKNANAMAVPLKDRKSAMTLQRHCAKGAPKGIPGASFDTPGTWDHDVVVN